MLYTSLSGSEANDSDRPGPERDRILIVFDVFVAFFGTVIDSELRALEDTGILALFAAVSSLISREYDAERFISREVFESAGPGAAAASCKRKTIFFVTDSLILRT